MFSASSLTEDQKSQISAWAAAGDQLPQLQQKIGSELGINVTYMDTRFLIIDLGIELVQEEAPEPEEEEAPTPLEPLGYVDATVDEIVRPGFLVSGSVTFSDDMKGTWGIDQMGRLSLDPDEAGYKPGEEDMVAFQEILRDKLAKK